MGKSLSRWIQHIDKAGIDDGKKPIENPSKSILRSHNIIMTDNYLYKSNKKSIKWNEEYNIKVDNLSLNAHVS